MRISLAWLVVAATLGGAVPAWAQRAAHGDSAAVVGVVTAFHEALRRADSAAALALLADDAIVLESGQVETRAEYRAHHLAADIGFSSATSTDRAVVYVVVADSAAWVASRSHTTGSFGERKINSDGAELMVLTLGADGWRIRAIHWSSRATR